MKQFTVVAVLFFTAVISSLANGLPQKNITSSVLKSAIVYRSGAELFHSAKLTLAQGNNEFIVDGISNKIELNSVQITADNKLTIMSVEFGTNFLRTDLPSPEMKKLQDSIESNEKELAQVQSNMGITKELQSVLAANKSIAGAQNGVSVQELTKMMDYFRAKSTELQKEMVQLREREEKLLKLLARLGQQKKEAEQKNVSSSGQLVFQAYAPVGGTYALTISYITPLASWNPSYDLRVENISKPINIGFKAKLMQTSGIDWKNVKLVLATSMPNLNATAPELQSWMLAFPELTVFRRQMTKAATRAVVLNEVETNYAMEGKLAGVSVRGSGAVSKPDPVYVVDGNVIGKEEFSRINKKAIKSIEVLKDAAAASLYGSQASGGAIVVTLKEGLEDYVNVSDNELNVTYEIDLPYDVPSNGKEQVVALKDRSVDASYKYYSAPVKDKDAYLLGCIADWGALQLLPGEANIIFEGTYVGKTYVNPVSANDTLNLTLGKDKRVVITREKLKDFSSVKFMGANKKQVITYEIAARNNKKETIQLQLKDLFPIPADKEIEVELLEFSGAEIDNEKSFLTWNIELKPGETKKFRLSYSVKYPKEKVLPL